MGVLSRFTNYIRTVMSHMLDRAEDPGQTLDYSYEKQLEQLQNLKRAFADVVTSKKRLELQEAQIQSQMAHYDDAARTALAQGREDLARLALERKQGLQAQLASFDQQIGQLNEQQAKIDTLQQRLTARVEAFRTQKEMVKAQYGAAQAQVRIQEAATGLSEEMQDVNLAVQRAQDIGHPDHLIAVGLQRLQVLLQAGERHCKVGAPRTFIEHSVPNDRGP